MKRIKEQTGTTMQVVAKMGCYAKDSVESGIFIMYYLSRRMSCIIVSRHSGMNATVHVINIWDFMW